MSYIHIPRTEDNPAYGAAPNVGFIGGTIKSIEQGLNTGLTNEAFNLISGITDNSPLLTQEEYNKSEYKRPGLEFKNGVRTETAKKAAERHDAKLEYQYTVDGISSGFLRGASQLVGNTIGFALDPTNLAIAAKIPALIGAKAAPYIAKLAETPYLRTAAAAAVGFGEGAAIMLPQEAANFVADKFYGEDPGLLHPLINLGLAGVIGGAARGAFGFKEPISPSADNIAKETAVNQLASGKSVRVDELMQYGAYEADMRALMREQEVTPPFEQKTAEQLSFERVTKPIEARARAQAEEAFINDLIQSREELLPLAADKLSKPEAQNLKQEIYQLNKKINEIEKNFDKYLARGREEKPKSTQKEAIERANKAVENEKKPVKDALAIAEDRIKRHEAAAIAEAELNRIDQAMAQVRGQRLLAEKDFLKTLDGLFKPDLINKPLPKSKIVSGDYELSELITSAHPSADALQIARNRIRQNIGSAILEAREAKPLTREQIKDASDYIQSYKSDSVYVESESKAFADEVGAISGEIDENLKHIEERVKAVEDSLPAEIKKDLADLREAGAQTEKVSSALQKIIDCLRGE